MHLGHGHEHAIVPRVLQIQVVLRRAQDGLGPQSQVLTDAVHGVHDEVADFQIPERDGDAFFDRA